MALRLAAWFETAPKFCLNLQLTYGLRKAKIGRGEAIKAQVQRIAHSA
jgi:plasmid maintenance system antidote protein VapI